MGENVLIFLGAGASAIFGLKTLQGLTKDLVKKMTKAGHGDEIVTIKAALRRFGQTPDFENIYTTLEALVNPRRGIKDSGPFAAYVAYKCKDFQRIKPRPKIKKVLEDFKRFIYEECTITPEELEKGKAAYDMLFSIVSGTKEKRHFSSTVGMSGTESDIQASETIVTTNYDMSMELYHSPRIADGFSPAKDPYIWEFNPKSYVQDGRAAHWLIKLHGSIWQFYHKGKFCKAIMPPEHVPNQKLKIKERMMIYPVGEKPILREPYYTFYKIFKEQPWQVMVAVGHSFRDLPVNVAILENLQERFKSKLIIVDRNPSEALKNLGVNDAKISERIIPVKGVFGNPITSKKLETAIHTNNAKQYQDHLNALGINDM